MGSLLNKQILSAQHLFAYHVWRSMGEGTVSVHSGTIKMVQLFFVRSMSTPHTHTRFSELLHLAPTVTAVRFQIHNFSCCIQNSNLLQWPWCKAAFFQRALDCAKAACCLRFIVFMEPWTRDPPGGGGFPARWSAFSVDHVVLLASPSDDLYSRWGALQPGWESAPRSLKPLFSVGWSAHSGLGMMCLLVSLGLVYVWGEERRWRSAEVALVCYGEKSNAVDLLVELHSYQSPMAVSSDWNKNVSDGWEPLHLHTGTSSGVVQLLNRILLRRLPPEVFLEPREETQGSLSWLKNAFVPSQQGRRRRPVKFLSSHRRKCCRRKRLSCLACWLVTKKWPLIAVDKKTKQNKDSCHLCHWHLCSLCRITKDFPNFVLEKHHVNK